MTNDQRSFAKALIGAISFFVPFVTLSLAVSKGVTDGLDWTVRGIVHGASSPALTASIYVATYLGSASLLVPLCLVSGLYLYLIGLRRQAAILIITMAGAVILENGLKLLVHRARPEPFFGVVAPETYSFPSGHTLFSTCFYVVVARIVGSCISDNFFRDVIWAVFAAIILIVGFSRVYLGVHYPSDVLGGFLAGAAWICVVSAVQRSLTLRARGPRWPKFPRQAPNDGT